MTQEERMKANLPYKAWLDGLDEKRMECKKKIKKYNELEPDDKKGKDELLRSLLGKAGKGLIIEQPFRCDYGENIFVGDNFWVNYNLTVLDVGRVTVGDNVLIVRLMFRFIRQVTPFIPTAEIQATNTVLTYQ